VCRGYNYTAPKGGPFGAPFRDALRTEISIRNGCEKEVRQSAATAIREWPMRHNADSLGMLATSGY
jgi:hypothetical protein